MKLIFCCHLFVGIWLCSVIAESIQLEQLCRPGEYLDNVVGHYKKCDAFCKKYLVAGVQQSDNSNQDFVKIQHEKGRCMKIQDAGCCSSVDDYSDEIPVTVGELSVEIIPTTTATTTTTTTTTTTSSNKKFPEKNKSSNLFIKTFFLILASVLLVSVIAFAAYKKRGNDLERKNGQSNEETNQEDVGLLSQSGRNLDADPSDLDTQTGLTEVQVNQINYTNETTNNTLHEAMPIQNHPPAIPPATIEHDENGRRIDSGSSAADSETDETRHSFESPELPTTSSIQQAQVHNSFAQNNELESCNQQPVVEQNQLNEPIPAVNNERDNNNILDSIVGQGVENYDGEVDFEDSASTSSDEE